MLIACAFLFSLHIMCIDRFGDVDGVTLSCIQFLTAGILASAGSILTEGFYFRLEGGGLISVLYAGIMSCGVAYTLQVLGQKETEPTIASMILCLESVFALIAGMIILGEIMSLREIIGCVIMFAAIVIANMPQDSLRISRS